MRYSRNPNHTSCERDYFSDSHAQLWRLVTYRLFQKWEESWKRVAASKAEYYEEDMIAIDPEYLFR